MVYSTGGSVRGTRAWRTRKVFREGPTTRPLGSKDVESRDVEAFGAEVNENHWTVYELWQKQKEKGINTPPTVTEVADKLNESEDPNSKLSMSEVKEIIHKTESHFGPYEDV